MPNCNDNPALAAEFEAELAAAERVVQRARRKRR